MTSDRLKHFDSLIDNSSIAAQLLIQVSSSHLFVGATRGHYWYMDKGRSVSVGCLLIAQIHQLSFSEVPLIFQNVFLFYTILTIVKFTLYNPHNNLLIRESPAC